MRRISMTAGFIERVVFQYSERCNMHCPYCYCPFLNKPVDPDLCLSIVERCVNLGAKVITFAGGDPFMYDSFRELLQYSSKLGVEIHVDTNGISMKEADYSLIADYVSLLALPLDGPNDSIQTTMRKMSGHFDVVLKHMSKLGDLPCSLKVNTVAALPNLSSLGQLAELLKSYSIRIWSLFQFWPLGLGVKNQTIFQISDNEYNQVVEKLYEMNLPFHLEAGTFSERNGYHFYVTHTGMVYTNNLADPSSYDELGLIFDDQVVEEWKMRSYSSIHPGSLQRYKSIKRT